MHNFSIYWLFRLAVKILKYLAIAFSVLFVSAFLLIAIFASEKVFEIFFILLLIALLVIIAFVSVFFFRNVKKSLVEHPLIIINLVLLAGLAVFGIRQVKELNKRLETIEDRFGGREKLACNESDLQNKLKGAVVRVIGSFGEGSGFPISGNRVITNFHVIDGELSPKVAFADGSFVTVRKILGDKDHDLAILVIEKDITALDSYAVSTKAYPVIGEPVFAVGYPMGSALPGPVTISIGSYGGQREDKKAGMLYDQTNISLVHGMSGGPLVDSCGTVLGVNTLGVAGLSLFLDIRAVNNLIPSISDKDIEKIKIDTSTAEGVVESFYTYIKTRNLEKAYALLSKDKTGDSTSDEWGKGYANTIQVDLITTSVDPKDKSKVYIKFASKDWVDGEAQYKYFEGDWQVIEEGGKLKLNKSNIKEVKDPGWDWFKE